MNDIKQRRFALLKSIFESLPNDTLPVLTERHKKLYEDKQIVKAPLQQEVLEGLKLFLERKLDKKYYSKPYSIIYGGGPGDIEPIEGNGSYTVNGLARFVFEHKGWEYVAEDVKFSCTYDYKQPPFSSMDSPETAEAPQTTLEDARWTDISLYVALEPLDKSKQSEIEAYEFTREALGGIASLLDKYFAEQ